MVNNDKNIFKQSMTLCLAIFLMACGQLDLTGEGVTDPVNGPADISYTFGTPVGFTVTAIDHGAQIFYKPNPTVDHYTLYIGSDAEMNEIEGIESPRNVGKANNIRIRPTDDIAGETFFFAVEAVDADGNISTRTAAKSVTIQDLEGTEVRFKAKLETCVQQRSKFIFRNGAIELYDNEDGTDLPGSNSSKCGIYGTRLTLNEVTANGTIIPDKPTYYFPGNNSGPWSPSSVGSKLNMKNESSSGPFAGLVLTENMIVSRDGEFKKSCEGVSLSHVYGRIESDDSDITNIIDLDGRNCATNNWFTYLEDGRESEFNFTLIFQTTSP